MMINYDLTMIRPQVCFLKEMETKLQRTRPKRGMLTKRYNTCCWVAPSDLHEADEIAHVGPEAEAGQELPVQYGLFRRDDRNMAHSRAFYYVSEM